MTRLRMYGIHVKAYAKMNTESRRQRPYASKSSEPTRLSHQKELGTTTCFCFSVAHHCTKKREKKMALPAQPTNFHGCHAIPRMLRNWLSLNICTSESMRFTFPQRPVESTKIVCP